MNDPGTSPLARRHFSLAGKLLLLVALHVFVASVAAAATAIVVPSPTLVFTAGALAGLLTAVWSVRLLARRATRGLDALSDGVRSLRDGDFSLRLAVARKDELGDLVSLYNEMADALRSERQEIGQRELLLDTVLQGAPIAIMLTGETGRIAFANRTARALFSGGRRMEGESFGAILDSCPSELAEAVANDGDTLFTVSSNDEEETYRASRRVFHLNMRRHYLYMVERLTPELRRREVEVWKKVIRVMSHEMNNSLAPIRSLVHSARTIVKDQEQTYRLDGVFDTIEDRATHLAEFLEGYARFARLAKPRKEVVSWGDFLASVALLSPFRPDGGLPPGEGWFDPSQMQQVLINLLKNAHESGSPAEDVRLSVHMTAEGGTAIRVSDRGKGMTPEELEQALLPFYSSKPLGTGLGLPLCNEILEAHGGRLRLQNRDGGGLVVTCLLPGRPEG